MTTADAIAVTLSPQLYSRLCRLARDAGLSLDWLVAGLVCDTIESLPEVFRPAGGDLPDTQYDTKMLAIVRDEIDIWSAVPANHIDRLCDVHAQPSDQALLQVAVDPRAASGQRQIRLAR